MAKRYSRLHLEQVEARVRPLRRLAAAPAPRGGWVRAIREALGMSAAQLAARLGVARQTVETYERTEAAGTITLESLNRIARAMNCRVAYALIPEEPLADIQRRRAEALADELIAPVAHTMRLEAQGTRRQEERRQRARLVQDLLQGDPGKLWR